MAGLVPAIHALLFLQGVDARHKAGHDEGEHRSRGRWGGCQPSNSEPRTL